MLASGGIKAGSEAFELAQAQGHNVTTARENSRAASSHFEAEKVKIDAEIDVCMIELRHIDRFLNHSKEASSGKLG